MNTWLIKQFKRKLEEEKVLVGPFMKTCDPAFVEVAGYAGMDFVILDMEHGPIGIENMQNNIRAAQISKTLPIVRVSELSETAIGKALDIGAAGIEIPQICNAEQARQAVKLAKFHPEGSRGVCRFVRASKYSVMDRNEYFKSANQTLIIAQLEGLEAMEKIDEILEVKGIDILFIGPYDLSQSLGCPGETTNPLVVQAMKDIIAKASSKGIVVGTFTDSEETMKMWANAGVQYISYSVDVGLFSDACKRVINNLEYIRA